MGSYTTYGSVSQQVFDTTELLEEILLHLGQANELAWRSLFVVQRVNKRFHDVLFSSPLLRRVMHIDPPKQNTSQQQAATVLGNYRTFFAATKSVLNPFRCHLRENTGPASLILALNVSLFWLEETPGVMVGRGPGDFDGSKAIEKNESWRRLVVPYYRGHDVELQCCGFSVVDGMTAGITLGEVADKAINAGKQHLESLEPVMYYGYS